MIEVSPDELRQAVEHLHGCRARLREVVRFTERHGDEVAWDGVVHVFDVTGIADVSTCFAWSSPIGDTDRRRFYAVLAIPPVNTAADAVRASIVSDHAQTQRKSEHL